MAKVKEIENVSRERLDQFRAKMKGYGVTVPPGDDVDIDAPLGVKMHATYNESAQVLTLEIIEKPMFVPESQIWSIVDSGTA
ncbi:MAG TPA: hypothetical protein PKA82_12855 [Pyrinomonadaceae bacterium]|nr:hypothetical protein [Pyrinomonadaceae bacterium]